MLMLILLLCGPNVRCGQYYYWQLWHHNTHHLGSDIAAELEYSLCDAVDQDHCWTRRRWSTLTIILLLWQLQLPLLRCLLVLLWRLILEFRQLLLHRLWRRWWLRLMNAAGITAGTGR
jgi:hypothetical protein